MILEMPKSRSFGSPLGGHQHVGRLQVAVDDELAMRIGHRPHHLDEERQDLLQLTALAPGIDRHAVDILERQIRTAAFGEARVVQHRNGRMLQPGEDGALARDALG